MDEEILIPVSKLNRLMLQALQVSITPEFKDVAAVMSAGCVKTLITFWSKYLLFMIKQSN